MHTYKLYFHLFICLFKAYQKLRSAAVFSGETLEGKEANRFTIHRTKTQGMIDENDLHATPVEKGPLQTTNKLKSSSNSKESWDVLHPVKGMV